jgi:hypothetical protein
MIEGRSTGIMASAEPELTHILQSSSPGIMNVLTLFGLVAVSLMMLCYALENRSHWFTLAFAASCVLASIYGFLQGAWPFGLVEGVWSVVAVKKWWTRQA